MKPNDRPPGAPARIPPGTARVPHHLMVQIHNENTVICGRNDSHMGGNSHG